MTLPNNNVIILNCLVGGKLVWFVPGLEERTSVTVSYTQRFVCVSLKNTVDWQRRKNQVNSDQISGAKPHLSESNTLK